MERDTRCDGRVRTRRVRIVWSQQAEQFLCGMGILPMNSSSRPEVSGLEQPWKLTPE